MTAFGTSLTDVQRNVCFRERERTSPIALRGPLMTHCGHLVRVDAAIHYALDYLAKGRSREEAMVARQKPLDVAVVHAWQAAWNECDLFSDPAVLHLQSFIADPHCLVVITLGAGREPRSLLFRRIKRVVPVPSAITPKPAAQSLKDGFVKRGDIGRLPSMTVSPVAPIGPSVGQLWHQTGVKSERVPKLERVLRWDGEDWVIAGYVADRPTIMKQGKQTCDFQEALACAHENANWLDCEFIYTYDGSTWGNA